MSESAEERGEERQLPAQVTQRDWALPWQGAFLEALARVPNVSMACRVVGVPRSTAYLNAQNDPVFREAWREAVDIGVDLMERIAHQRATTGHEVEETRRRTKRQRDARSGELIVVEEETITVTRNEVSDGLMVTLLKAYRPRRFREQVEHHLGPADDLESTQVGGPEDDGIHRKPTREQALELVRIARELEEQGIAPVINPDGSPAE